MSMDFRGDPSAALLEVLDPEQNCAFSDHYLDLDYDLSQIFFITTANSLHAIPLPLQDRMEIIRLPGYLETEKRHIARHFLIPKQITMHGLVPEQLPVTEEAVLGIIRSYTREAGVRGLEREISRVCRKVVKMLLLKKNSRKVTVSPKNIDKFLGVRQFDFGVAEKENQVGQVCGLAWTEFGGEMLTIEAVTVPGKGGIIRTGTLGDVMKESIEAARTVVRSRANKLGIKNEAFEKTDIHVHVPEGATPKDGPSAGISMATALVSVYSGIPVRADVAMTGEITLRGEVLPIGGVKEKLLAALRGGIKTVIIPEENAKDLVEIPDNVKNKLEILPVRWIDKVLEIALERQPDEVTEAPEEVPSPAVASETAGNPNDNNLIRH
jgi:ATP-dependent Lon protease